MNPTGHSEFADHLEKHGDGVKDVAFSVDDATAIFHKAVKKGALAVMQPTTLKDDHGEVIVASV